MHPTVKPINLTIDLILDVTNRNDIILDGFLGSGTTVMAAERTGRICYGTEIDPRYVDTILHRWLDLTGVEPIHAETGLTFTEIEAQRVAEMLTTIASTTSEVAHHVSK